MIKITPNAFGIGMVPPKEEWQEWLGEMGIEEGDLYCFFEKTHDNIEMQKRVFMNEDPIEISLPDNQEKE